MLWDIGLHGFGHKIFPRLEFIVLIPLKKATFGGQENQTTHGLARQKACRFVVAIAAILTSCRLLLVEPLSPRYGFIVLIPLKKPPKGGFFNGADTRTRTADPLITKLFVNIKLIRRLNTCKT